MQTPSIRIALSGSTGVGKTTLARALAGQLGVPLLEEDFVPVIRARRAYTQDAQRGSPDLPESREAYLEACDAWFRGREARQASLTGFVADRWAADLLGALLLSGLGRDYNERVAGWIAQCQRQARQFDLVVMPPMQRVTREARNEAGLPRSNSLGQRLVDHCLLRGLIEQLVPTPRLYLPVAARTVESRLELVSRAVDRILARKAAGEGVGLDAARGPR